MYRYRLVDEDTGSELGPLVSARPTFEVGDTIGRSPDEHFVVVNVVPPENENFRAYVVVRAV